jgi:hypothetical protein
MDAKIEELSAEVEELRNGLATVHKELTRAIIDIGDSQAVLLGAMIVAAELDLDQALKYIQGCLDALPPGPENEKGDRPLICHLRNFLQMCRAAQKGPRLTKSGKRVPAWMKLIQKKGNPADGGD